jgi:predicted RNA-binding Zn ribbon-like protein
MDARSRLGHVSTTARTRPETPPDARPEDTAAGEEEVTLLALPDDQTPAGWGGRLAFSLVNSVLWRRSDDPEDTLDSYGRLVDIAADSGWLPDAETLRVAGKRGPAPARLAMSRAIELREHLFAIFSSLADDEPVPAVSLSRLNEVFGQALSQLQLAPREPGARIDWRSPVDPDLPLWLIAISAAELLTATDQDRIKQCPGERCGWVFYDTTRNRSRRWCEDSQCGNRARAKRYYQRHHAS